jgi:hypothetical protein
MRNLFIIVPLFFVLLAILYLFTPVFPGKISHEVFVDEDVRFFITQYDLEQRLDEFIQSPFGQALGGLDIDAIGRELGFSQEQAARVIQLKQEAARTSDDPLLRVLFGSEASVALFDFTLTEALPLEAQIFDNLLFISRPQHSARLMDFAGWFGLGEDKVGESRYGGHAIKRFDLEAGRRISAVRVKDLLVFSFNEQLLRHSLDIYDTRQQTLLDSPDYSKLKKSFAGASLFCYLNFIDIDQQLQQTTASAIPPGFLDHGLSLDEMDSLSGYRAGYFGAWKENDTIIDRAVISFDPDLLQTKPHHLTLVEPALPDSFNRVSGDTIFYYWTNNFDLKRTLAMFAGTESSAAQIEANLEGLAQITGVTPQRLIELIDSEVTIGIKGIGKNQLVPIPLFLLVLKSSDMETLQPAVEKLISHFQIPIREKTIGEAEIITWGGMVGMGTVQPSLSFVGDSLIISSNRTQISEYLSLPEGTGGLAQNNFFMQLEEDLIQPSNFITYLDFGETITNVKEMVSWGSTMLAIKDRETARRSKALTEQLVYPLLDGLAMYSVIGTRKYIAGDTIVFESTTLLEHGKQ